MPGIVQLGIRSPDLQDLTGIARFPNVETLRVMNSAIVSFEGLEACPNIKNIDASLCRSLGSLRGLQNARKLEELNLNTALIHWGGEDRTPGRLASLHGLEHCESLVELDATGHAITSMKGSERCTKLRRLNLERNRITRIEGLERLTQLVSLDVSGNPLDSLDGIKPVSNTLVWLHVDDTPVDSLEPVRGCKILNVLTAKNTRITSVEPLSGSDSGALYHVDVSGSPVRSLRGLEVMWHIVPTIKARGCKLASLEGLPHRDDYEEIDLDDNDIPPDKLDAFYKRVKYVR